MRGLSIGNLSLHFPPLTKYIVAASFAPPSSHTPQFCTLQLIAHQCKVGGCTYSSAVPTSCSLPPVTEGLISWRPVWRPRYTCDCSGPRSMLSRPYPCRWRGL